jgi:hypothetical protein
MTGTHRDYEPFEMAENMEEDLGLFEAAMRSRRIELDRTPLAQLLVVSDGGELSGAVRDFGRVLAGRLSATHTEFQAPGPGTASASDIPTYAEQVGAGLIVLPVPCGESLSELQSQSLGTTAELLLHGCPTPQLCIRGALPPDTAEAGDAADAALQDLLVVLARDDAASVAALAWALRLAPDHARLTLLELADAESLATAEQLQHDREEEPSVREAIVGRAVASRLGSLIAVAQRRALAQGVILHTEFRLGQAVEEILAVAERLSAGLLIVARPEDRTSAGFHLVQDLLLATRRPVLVV